MGNGSWLQNYKEVAQRRDDVSNDAIFDTEQSLQSFIIPMLNKDNSPRHNTRIIVFWIVRSLTWPGAWVSATYWAIALFPSFSLALAMIGVTPLAIAIAFGWWVCKRDKATTMFGYCSLALGIISISFFLSHLV